MSTPPDDPTASPTPIPLNIEIIHALTLRIFYRGVIPEGRAVMPAARIAELREQARSIVEQHLPPALTAELEAKGFTLLFPADVPTDDNTP